MRRNDERYPRSLRDTGDQVAQSEVLTEQRTEQAKLIWACLRKFLLCWSHLSSIEKVQLLVSCFCLQAACRAAWSLCCQPV